VAHLHDVSLGPLVEALRAETGFELTPDREVAIPGLCPACQESHT
jgi:Fe2+ or Zn2+ uptake regulation protein